MRVDGLTRDLYGEPLPGVIADWLSRHKPAGIRDTGVLPSAILCTYPDNLDRDGTRPLATLDKMLGSHFQSAFDTLHVLPFLPSSGDGGFAVTNHESVDPRFGAWEDILALSSRFRLMGDLVLNHVSSKHNWVRRYLKGDPAFANFFVAPADGVDLSAVSRPRSSPLLTRFQAFDGPRSLWTTYGPDQVDLNFAEPRVLAAVADMADYLSARGIAILRLDAVAFIWKRIGSSCANLPEAAAVVSLLRAMLATSADCPLLVSETDASYGAEHFTEAADLAYRYDLAPSLTHALVTGRPAALIRWMVKVADVDATHRCITFIATHDALFLRHYAPPLLPREQAELERAAALVGNVAVRRAENGPLYEIAGPVHAMFSDDSDTRHRLVELSMFLLASLPGIPMVYLNTILDAPRAPISLEEGPRSTNRFRFSLDEAYPAFRTRLLERTLAIFSARRTMPVTNGPSSMNVFHVGESSLGFSRFGPGGTFHAVANLSRTASVRVHLPTRAHVAEPSPGVVDYVDVAPMGHVWAVV